MAEKFKLTVERNAFLKALGHSQTVVERRHTVPILSHVLLEAGTQELKLTATDLEVSIVESIPARVEDQGRATVSAHMLYEIVKKLPDGSEIEIFLNAERSQLEFQCGRSRFQLSCLPAEDFPALNQGEFSHTFKMLGKDLVRLMDRTRFAMSHEETRYTLNGVYFHAHEEQELRAVATDGHRLAKAGISIPEGAKGIPGVILSRKTVAEVMKVVSDDVPEVQVSLSETQIRFELPGIVLTSRLIDGSFPDYHKVIPEGNDKVLQIDMAAFFQAVDRVATISSEKNRGIKVGLSQGKVVLSADGNEMGSAIEEVEVAYESEPLEIGFNSRYLLDVAQQVEGEGVELSMADSGSPVMIKGQGDEGSLFVIMPMRV